MEGIETRGAGRAAEEDRGRPGSLIWKGLRQEDREHRCNCPRSTRFPDLEGIETFGFGLGLVYFRSTRFPDLEGIETLTDKVGSLFFRRSTRFPDLEGIETSLQLKGKTLEFIRSTRFPDLEGIETSGEGPPSFDCAGSTRFPDLEGIETTLLQIDEGRSPRVDQVP